MQMSDIAKKNIRSNGKERGERGANKISYLKRPEKKRSKCPRYPNRQQPIEIDRQKGIMSDNRQNLNDGKVERTAIWKVNCVQPKRRTQSRYIVVPRAFVESFCQGVDVKSIAPV